jgi:hypothetical protein
VVEDAHASLTEAQSMAESPLAEESEQAKAGALKAVGLHHASTERLQTEHNGDAMDGQGVEESHLQAKVDQTAQPSLEKLPSVKLKRPGRVALNDEAPSGVRANHVAGVASGPPRVQQKQPVNSSPFSRSQSAGWSNGGEQRSVIGGWQGSPGGRGNARQERNPSFSRSQQLDISQPLPGPPPPRRQASGGHGRGWQQAPHRYSPQGRGTGYQSRSPSGHKQSQNPYNPYLEESPPGNSKASMDGKRSSSLDIPAMDIPARGGQSHSPQSSLNWGWAGNPSLEELSLGPSVAQPLPPVPQPLPPYLVEGGSTSLTIKWDQSPLCQCYFLDMALSSERVRESDSPRLRAGEPERLVGESLDWRPVYSGEDAKCQVRDDAIFVLHYGLESLADCRALYCICATDVGLCIGKRSCLVCYLDYWLAACLPMLLLLHNFTNHCHSSRGSAFFSVPPNQRHRFFEGRVHRILSEASGNSA